ncbi:MAG: xanthine dehydrogenase family protein molybdopterin-binding subunit [Gaiellaceae bacterium]
MIARATQAQARWIGRPLRRKEDPRLITGRGRYVDDVVLPGMLYAAFVRSTEGHARIVSIDKRAALESKAVRAVLVADDLELARPLPMIWHPPGVEINEPEHWPLAGEVVKYVGEAVAVVVAGDRYTVADAAETVVVEYDRLPAVVDPEAALEEGSPLVHERFGTNRTHEWLLGGGDMEAALAEADLTVERRVPNHRTAGAAIEPRGVVAEWRAGELTVWTSTQIPHLVRHFLAGELALPEDAIRVIAPDVGGGFGSKLNHYAEELLVAAVARKLGRPVKWIETRSENLAATTHGRGLLGYATMGAKRDGTLTALDVRLIADLGAYHQLFTPAMPALAAYAMSGCYRIPAVRVRTVGVFTNKVAIDSVRGAGRPEAIHVVETMIDQTAAELRMDPLELRRKNFIPKESFPATVALGLTYDSGDYEAALDKLLEHVDLAGFRREQAALREEGIYRGIGFSTYTEICGFGPSRPRGPDSTGFEAGFWESAVVRVHASGDASIYTGTSAHGQGHETMFAQIVGDALGLDPERVAVLHGDTDEGPFGMGTYGSRSAAVGGTAAARAAAKVADKALRIAAALLDVSPEEVERTNVGYEIRATPDAAVTHEEVARAAYVPERLPKDIEPGLEETAFYDPDDFLWPFGAHAAVVEVDAETGKVTLVRYVAVDDCGRVINPLLVDGQIHGGIAHAVGQALYEQIVYTPEGQLATGTFVDYGLPTAAELPSFETDLTETPTPINELGVKGVGEAATIGCSPAITNAVVDALRPLGVTSIDMPLTPLRVWQALQNVEHGQAAP